MNQQKDSKIMWNYILVAVIVCMCVHTDALPAPSILKNEPDMEGFGKIVKYTEELMKLWLEWGEWKQEHSKEYESVKENLHRYQVWLENRRKVNTHNSDTTKSHKLGMNVFADLTHEEFKDLYLSKAKFNPQRKGIKFLPPLGMGELATNVNWTCKGYVTPVKSQGQCGSCWAFSSTGSLEGQYFRATNKLESLSEQNLLDCSSDYGNQGCAGGLMDYAFEYIKSNGGIDSESSYPYEGVQNNCQYDKSNSVTTLSSYVDIPEGDEDSLKTAVATQGPVSIAIDASHSSFQLYHSGVYEDPECSSSDLDHGVLAVGYGVEDGQEYWLVKNSWGTAWGEQGYVKMLRDADNQCGVATVASYPLL